MNQNQKTLPSMSYEFSAGCRSIYRVTEDQCWNGPKRHKALQKLQRAIQDRVQGEPWHYFVNTRTLESCWSLDDAAIVEAVRHIRWASENGCETLYVLIGSCKAKSQLKGILAGFHIALDVKIYTEDWGFFSKRREVERRNLMSDLGIRPGTR